MRDPFVPPELGPQEHAPGTHCWFPKADMTKEEAEELWKSLCLEGYHIPSMNVINSIPYNGYNVVSLFSGCGGSSLGYRWAGFKVLYANEFIKYASDSYRANFPDTFLDTRDIRDIAPAEILLKCNLITGALDVLDGSPPCAPFSDAGVKDDKWGKKKRYSTIHQRVDDLFDEYVRILRGLKPKVFIAENVEGMTRGRAKGKFLEMIEAFGKSGYDVQASLIDCSQLGVPQKRVRLIFIGVRNDLQLLPSFPKKVGETISLGEAFHGLTAPIEPEAYDLPDSVCKKYRRLGHNEADRTHFNLRRSSWDIPAYTVCASGGDKHTKTIMHPDECRKFSIPELKRICSFPDDFVLTSSYRHQYERLGRAFPPKAMYEIAKNIQVNILDRIPKVP